MARKWKGHSEKNKKTSSVAGANCALIQNKKKKDEKRIILLGFSAFKSGQQSRLMLRAWFHFVTLPLKLRQRLATLSLQQTDRQERNLRSYSQGVQGSGGQEWRVV